MTRPPTRLLDSGALSDTERALLEAGRDVAPVHYDAAAGALRFQQTLQALGAGQGAVTTTSTATSVTTALGQGATLTKLAFILVPALGLGGYLYASQAPAEATRADVVTIAADVVEPEVAQGDARRLAAPPVTETPLRGHVANDDDDGARLPTAPREKRRVSSRTRSPSVGRGRDSRSAADVPPGEMDGVADESPRTPPAAPSTSSPSVASRADVRASIEPAPVREPVEAPAVPSSETPVTQPPGDDESIDELRGIAQARAWVSRDPEAALTLLQRVARAHPHGYFVEEREALTILALAGSGQAALAEQRGQAFLRKSPRSPFASRVRAAIGRD